MSDQIATEDIIERNQAGQMVVVVPKGQPIPAHMVPTRPVAAKKVDGPVENKARKMPARKRSDAG